MPVIDGKVHRAIYTKLKLTELSSVDRPACVPAKAVILKRDDSADDRSPADASAGFMGKAQEIAKRDNLPLTQAMNKAMQEHPEAFAAMQAAPVTMDRHEPVPGAEAVEKAVRDFTAIARKIAERDAIPLYAALGKARVEAPAAFAVAYP